MVGLKWLSGKTICIFRRGTALAVDVVGEGPTALFNDPPGKAAAPSRAWTPILVVASVTPWASLLRADVPDLRAGAGPGATHLLRVPR